MMMRRRTTIKCYTFLEQQARSDLNDDDDDNDNDINDDNKEEDDDDKKLFFSKVSSVIPFRNHKLGLI